MSENVTNITNLITNAYSIAAWGLQLWKWLAGIGVPVGAIIIMFKYFAHLTCDITLIHYKNKKSSCKYPANPIWLRHRITRMGVSIFTPWMKYKKAVKKWEESFDIANNEISLRVRAIDKYRNPTDDFTWEFIESEDTLKRVIEKTISDDMKGDLRTAKLKIKQFTDDRYELRCGGRLVAHSYPYDEMKKIENSLRNIIEDENIKRLIGKKSTDFQEMNHLEQSFKIRFAGLVSFMRMWDSILSFKKASYPRDLNANK